MKTSLVFESNDLVELPLSYNHALQSLILKVISKELPDIHEKGPYFKVRQYRTFVFSRIFGKHSITNGRISFETPISFSIASPFDKIIQAIGNQFLNADKLEIIGNKLRLVKLMVSEQKVDRSPVKVITRSPITIRSTFVTPEGKKKSYYYNPYESDFEIQIKENLLRKAKAIGLELSNSEFSIRPIGNMKQRIIRYKGFTVIAWDGIFELSGNHELINLAFDWGLGSKNAQGFGMIEAY